MINHKATISALTNEFLVLVDNYILEVYSQFKDTLNITIGNEDVEYNLEFSAETPYDRILLRNSLKRANKNSVDLYDFLLDSRVTNISQINDDRILAISTDKYDLYFFLFGHSKSDLIITNKDGKIISSFKGHQQAENDYLNIPYTSDKKLNEFSKDTPLIKSLKSCEYYFGKYYSSDIISKNNFEPKITLDKVDLTELQSIADKYYKDLTSSKQSFVYELDNNKYLFTLKDLDGLKPLKYFDTISKGIEYKSFKEANEKQKSRLKNKIKNHLLKLLKKEETALERIGNLDDGEKKAKQYELFAQLLQSQPNPKKLYGKNIELTDWEGNKVKIKLDKDKDLIENSIKYYKKASSVKKEREKLKKKLPKIESEVENLKELIEKTEKEYQIKKLENIIKSNYKILGHLLEDKSSMNKEDKFRKFELQEGYVLYVGKNAKNNDELTMKFAKPNDIWLHARGVGGSHCVIRVPKKDKPSKRIIREAAEIAAYYSQAKNAKVAPVAYTEKKYVRKPKGANAGAVTMSREDVIMVEPRLPND